MYYILTLSILVLITSCNDTYRTKSSKTLPSHYRAEQIEGRVIDAQTKAPLKDAIVIALWELKKPYSIEGDTIAGHMQVTEVLTDKEGHYVIPGWGPKERLGKTTYLGKNDPLIVVFKEEYDYLTLKNKHGYRPENQDKRYEEAHRSSWDGETVELKRFEGDLEAYIDRLSRVRINLESLLHPVFGAGYCDWMKVPKMMIVFDDYRVELKEAGKNTILIPRLDVLIKDGKCGVESKEEFKLEHTK